MAATMFFKKQKITVLAFEDRDDLRQTMLSLIEIDRRTTPWPRFYAIDDPTTTPEETADVKNFLERMMSLKADTETIRRNLQKDRFKELL